MLQALGLGRVRDAAHPLTGRPAFRRTRAGHVGLMLALAAPGVVGLVAAVLAVHVFRSNAHDLLVTDVASRLGREARELQWDGVRAQSGSPMSPDHALIDVAAIDAEFARLPDAIARGATPVGDVNSKVVQAEWERWRAWSALRPELVRIGAGGRLDEEGITRFAALASAFEHSAAGAAEVESAQLAMQIGVHTRWLVWMLVIQVAGLLLAAGLKLLDQRRLAAAELVLRRLSAINEHTRASVALCAPDGRIDWANAAFVQSAGLAHGEVIGRKLDEVLAPKERDGEAMRILRRAWLSRSGASGEMELARSDGSSLWVAAELVPMANDEGSIERFAVIFTDVTPRVTAAQALETSEARFRGALGAMTEGLLILDADDRIVGANTAAESILGVPPGSLLGQQADPSRSPLVRPDGTRLPPEETPYFVTRRTGRSLRGIVLGHTRPDGELRWIEFTTALVRLPGDDRPGMVSTFVDVTEKRQADAEIQRLTRVVEQSPVLVMITDREHRIEYVNRAFENRTGWSLDEVRGRTSAFMLSSRTDPAAFANVLEELARQGEWCSEIWNVARDGSEWLALSHAYPLRGEDGRDSYVALLEDITEQRRREDELARAREEAVAASKAKSEFLQNMSHELHTPLNGILGMAELLLETPLDDCQRADLMQVCRSARDLHTLINHLFDFARLEDGATAAQSVPFRLGDCLESVTRRFAADAAERGLACDVEIDPRLPDGLRGDPAALVRVLRLLADNAIKFTETGGVRMRVLAEPGPGGDPHVRFEVHDTGIGIPPERQKAIFEAFWQADGSSTRRYGGVGLGLALASKLVRLMGGRLSVASEPGRGSVFSFSVPLHDAGEMDARPELRPESPGAASANGGPCRALVVDDNAVNRRVASRLLGRVAFEVTTANDGLEAVQRYCDGDWDIVLMDVQMPQLDGIEATRRIRAFEREACVRRVPILAVTANTLQADLPALREAGMDDLVPKPVAPEQLYAAMTRLLGRPIVPADGSAAESRAA